MGKDKDVLEKFNIIEPKLQKAKCEIIFNNEEEGVDANAERRNFEKN